MMMSPGLHQDVHGILREYIDTVAEIKVLATRDRNLRQEAVSCVEILGGIAESLDVNGNKHEERITLLLAQSGMGKSTTLNEAARQTEITDALYKLLKADEEGEIDDDYELREPPRDYFERPNIKQMLKTEEDLEELYMKICSRNKENLPEFILPQAEPFSCEGCTPLIMEVTYGAYALKLEFYTEEELRTMLSEFPFDEYRLDSTKNSKSLIQLRHMTSLLRTLQQVTEEDRFEKEEDFKFEDSETDEAVADADQQTEEKLIHPTYKQKATVKIHPSMHQYMGLKVMFKADQASTITQDRVFIREKIKEIIESKYCSLVKKLGITIPCLVAKNNKILEVPGTDDDDPLHQSQLLKALARANNVIVLSSDKSLKVVSDRVKQLLDEHVLPHWVNGRNNFRLSVLSCPKTSDMRLSCEQLVKDVKEKESSWKKFNQKYMNSARTYLAGKLRKIDPRRFCSTSSISEFFKAKLRVACCQLFLGSALQRSKSYIRKHGELFLNARLFAQSTSMLRMLWGNMKQGSESQIEWLDRQLRQYVEEVGHRFQIKVDWHIPSGQLAQKLGPQKHLCDTAAMLLKNRRKNFQSISDEIIFHEKGVIGQITEMKNLFNQDNTVVARVESALTCSDPEKKTLKDTLSNCLDEIIAYVDKLKRSDLRLLLDPTTEGRQGVFSMEKKLRPYIDESLRDGKLKKIYLEEYRAREEVFCRNIREAFCRKVMIHFDDKETPEAKLASEKFKTWLEEDYTNLANEKNPVKEKLELQFKELRTLIDRAETYRWITEAVEKTIKQWSISCLSRITASSRHARNDLKTAIRRSFVSLDSESDSDSQVGHSQFEFERTLAENIVKAFRVMWRKRCTKMKSKIFFKKGAIYQWLLRLCEMLANRKKTRRTKTETTIEKFLPNFVAKLRACQNRFDIAGRKKQREGSVIDTQLNALRYQSVGDNAGDPEFKCGSTSPELKIHENLKKLIRRWIIADRKPAEFDLAGHLLSDECGFLRVLQAKVSSNDDKYFKSQVKTYGWRVEVCPWQADADQSLLWSLLVCQKIGFLRKGQSSQKIEMQKLAEIMGLRILTSTSRLRWPEVQPQKSSQFFFQLAGIQRSDCAAGRPQKLRWLHAQCIHTFCDHHMCNVCIVTPSIAQVYMISPSNSDDKTKPTMAYFIVWDERKKRFNAIAPHRVTFSINAAMERDDRKAEAFKSRVKKTKIQTQSSDHMFLLHHYLREGFKSKLWDGFDPMISDMEYTRLLAGWFKTKEEPIPITKIPTSMKIKKKELGFRIISKDSDGAKSIVVALREADKDMYSQHFGEGDGHVKLRRIIVEQLEKLNREKNVIRTVRLGDWNIRMENIKNGAPLNFLDIKAAADWLRVKITCITEEGVVSYTPQEVREHRRPTVLALAKCGMGKWFALGMGKRNANKSNNRKRQRGPRSSCARLG